MLSSSIVMYLCLSACLREYPSVVVVVGMKSERDRVQILFSIWGSDDSPVFCRLPSLFGIFEKPNAYKCL